MLNTISIHFRKGRFGRHVATMLTGNITAQLIGFIAAPLITRLYSPDDFGIMTLIWTYITILSVASCLGYEEAIIIEPDDGNALNLYALCNMITIVLVTAIVLFISVFSEKLVVLMNFNHSERYLWFIPIAFMTGGFSMSLISWNTRKQEFTRITLCNVAKPVLTNGLKLAFPAVLSVSAAWLLLSNVMGIIGPAFLLFLIFLNQNFATLQQNVSIPSIKSMARKYNKFPKYQVGTRLMNTTSQNFQTIIMAYFFPSETIGYLGLGYTIIRRPISLVGISMSKVFLQKIADDHARGENSRRHFYLATKGLALVGIIPFCILGLAGEQIFSLIFGQAWATAGLYSQLMAPWLFLLFINPPATQVIIVKQKLKQNLIFNSVSLVLRFSAIAVTAILFSDPVIVISAFSAVGVILNLFYIGYAYRVVIND